MPEGRLARTRRSLPADYVYRPGKRRSADAKARLARALDRLGRRLASRQEHLADANSEQEPGYGAGI